jgi:hypothetical protein
MNASWVARLASAIRERSWTLTATRQQSAPNFSAARQFNTKTFSMSFLKWFSNKSQQARTVAYADVRHSGAGGSRSALAQHQRLAAEGGKLKRHARREQLYVAIREAMTRGGVLSASYKFKVLSLDQPGNEFLVMLDLGKAFDGAPEQLGGIEALIVQNAKARFEITVPAVYWRTDAAAASGKPQPRHAHEAAPVPAQPVKSRGAYEPIRTEEVVAFKQALLAASAHGPSAAAGGGSKSRSGMRSYTLLTGFEDTEVAEQASAPALSPTQYGELN